MMQEHSLDEWAVLHIVKTLHWHLCHHCDRCDSSYYNIYIISIEALLYSNPLIHYTRNMYILSVTSVTPVTPLDLKWHVFFGWFFTVGQDVAYVGSGTLIELPETAVLTAYLLKPKVCQCQPDFGGIDLHIRRKSCRYLRGCHVIRLRFGGRGINRRGCSRIRLCPQLNT